MCFAPVIRKEVLDAYPDLEELLNGLSKRLDNITMLELTARIEFGHNYNQVRREAMYRWFKKHLKFSGEPVETEIEYLKPNQLTVFDEDHPRPPSGEHFERNLLVGLAATITGGGEQMFVEMVMNAAEASNGKPQSFKVRNWIRVFAD